MSDFIFQANAAEDTDDNVAKDIVVCQVCSADTNDYREDSLGRLVCSWHRNIDEPEEPFVWTQRFGLRRADPTKMRAVQFIWKPWLVAGALNLMVGEEKVGKSTFSAYIAARLTTGELPGAYEGQPMDVVFVGADEDDWDTATMPRLAAAGADFQHVHEFYSLRDDDIFTADAASELAKLLRGCQKGVVTSAPTGMTTDNPSDSGVALVVFEHLMDLLPRLSNPNDPVALRKAMQPLRRTIAAAGVAGLGTLHVNKADAKSFRQKAQGSMQYGAMSRSNFLIARHPHNKGARVAVLGPSNYVKDDEPQALAFTIAPAWVSLPDGGVTNVGHVGCAEQDNVSMADVLQGDQGSHERNRDEFVEEVLGRLSVVSSKGTDNLTTPKSAAAVARELGRKKTDSSVHRAIRQLADLGLIEKVKGGWVRVPDEDQAGGSQRGTTTDNPSLGLADIATEDQEALFERNQDIFGGAR